VDCSANNQCGDVCQVTQLPDLGHCPCCCPSEKGATIVPPIVIPIFDVCSTSVLRKCPSPTEESCSCHGSCGCGGNGPGAMDPMSPLLGLSAHDARQVRDAAAAPGVDAPAVVRASRSVICRESTRRSERLRPPALHVSRHSPASAGAGPFESGQRQSGGYAAPAALGSLRSRAQLTYNSRASDQAIQYRSRLVRGV
jgi:hypothetical protein